MKKIKFLSVLAIVLSVFAVFSACVDDSSSSSSKRDSSQIEKDGQAALTFVSINDIHGYIEQDDNGKGGLSNTAYMIDKMSAFYGDDDDETTTRDDVVLFANGDIFQGTAISNMSRGAAVVAAMNEMGFDGMGIGNHEFDWGLNTITKYWDGQNSDIKANFPLVTSNISQKSADNTLLGDLSDDDNILPYTVVEKMGVKVGLIGAIGPCENSILQTMVADYTFEDVTQSVKNAALALKNEGADIISVNIHYGNVDDPTRYGANRNIASLKDNDGDYLVDIIFNGHTHSRQKAYIERPDGSFVPIVQGGCNNNAVAYVKLVYDKDEDQVSFKGYGYEYVSTANDNYDFNVQNVITNYTNNLLNSLPSLAKSAVTPSRSDFYDYVADIMLSAFESDYCISNFGGIRSNGNIRSGEAIKESNLYEVIPFDNAVYYIEMQGNSIYEHYKNNNSSCFYGVNEGAKDISYLKGNTNYYTVSVIDYVYTGKYFDAYRSGVRNETNTLIQLRELLIEDVTEYGRANTAWNPAKGSKLSKHEW